MTIKDLAAQTGYSLGTISRVLNNHPNVSQKAREVILQAVTDSGFQLNTNAKQLKQQQGNGVLMVVKGTNNEMFAELVQEIQSHFVKLKYPLMVDYLDEDMNEVARGVQLCVEKKPLGIFFLGGNRENFLNDFDKIDIPCVLVTNDASEFPFPNLSSVSTNDREAARCAMDSLIELGHRDFAIVGGDLQMSDISRLRYEGCLQALRSKGIPYDEKMDYRAVRFSYYDGYTATKQLLDEGCSFTALFAFSDVMAIGAMRALWEKGLRVPEDVSVMGFDGLPLGDFMVPQLSTIHQLVKLMAQRSVEIMLDCIETGGIARYETVPYAVKQRESTRQVG